MKRFKNILCVVDAHAKNGAALERAVALAENNQANLTVISVVERISAGIGIQGDVPIPLDLQKIAQQDHLDKLNSHLQQYKDRAAITARILSGSPFLEIIREVLRGEHDLVIKNAETYNWMENLFGSNDMHLLRKCPCPVWLLKPGIKQTFRRILAAVDLDDAYGAKERTARHQLNIQLLEMAGSLALSDFSELHVVHVWQALGERTLRSSLVQVSDEQISAYIDQIHNHRKSGLKQLLSEFADTAGKSAYEYMNPQSHLIKGWARKEIPALARSLEIDLVVMGTVGRTGIPGFLMGNTAETILSQINCSVLAVKPPGFVTPITLDDE